MQIFFLNSFFNNCFTDSERNKFLFQLFAFTSVRYETNEDTTNLKVLTTRRESLCVVILHHGNVDFILSMHNYVTSRLIIFSVLLFFKLVHLIQSQGHKWSAWLVNFGVLNFLSIPGVLLFSKQEDIHLQYKCTGSPLTELGAEFISMNLTRCIVNSSCLHFLETCSE